MGLLRRVRKEFTRVFFATDLHASSRTFRKFVNAATAYEAQVLVMGGDVCGKVLTPIVAVDDGTYDVVVHGEHVHVTSEEELARVREALDTQGHYHTVVSRGEYERLAADPAVVDELLERLARERLAAWRAEAERRLAPLGVRCFVTGGNDDRPEVLETLAGADGVLVFCEGRAVAIDERHVMVSCGFSNPTPWATAREVGEDELARLIDQAVADVDDFANVVFNFHAPPYDSTLDVCPKLDASTDPPTPVYQGGQPALTSAGSTAVRAAIERHQPLLGLHGHIHESRSAAEIGRTLCINPGSEYGEGFLRGCIVNLGDGEVVSYQLTSG
jgi:Icc-related predicted phosphoesterase